MQIMRAMLGVHCKCVTPWRRIWAAMEKSSLGGGGRRVRPPQHLGERHEALEHLAVGMP